MKKILACILAGILLLTCVCAFAESEAPAETEAPETEENRITYDYEHLTVAVTTPLNGNFFTDMWGNVTSDIDVRSMIHGYNLVEWSIEEGMFRLNPSVISGTAITREEDMDLVFVLALYDDLTYSDGTPITAWDYAFSMLLSVAPEMKEIGAKVKTPEYIKGYREYAAGETSVFTGIKVLGDDMLSITIDAAYLPFFYELGLLDCVPYPISVIAPGVKVADDGEGVYLTNADPEKTEPVFTAELLRGTILDGETGYRTHPSVVSGPYVLTSYGEGTAEFEINPKYKGDSRGRKPMIQRVTVVSPAAEEQIPGIAEGSITLLSKASDAENVAAGLALTRDNEMLTNTQYPRIGLSFIGFNTERAPMDDLRVRKAIAYATDRNAIITEAVGGYGLRSDGFYGLGQWMFQILNGTLGFPVEEPEEGADAQAWKDYEDEIAEWEKVTLDGLQIYDYDPQAAARLLDEAGWNLNENGGRYDPEKDAVRCRQTENGPVPLKLTLAYGQDSAAGTALEILLKQNLADVGIQVEVSTLPAKTLMEQYYRQAEPEYDMLFLATNFDELYDPSEYFVTTEEGKHVWQAFGLEDEELWEKTVDMRRTEPGDVLSYVIKWVEFQKAFTEKLPALPVYSNVYFDFYPRVLHDYTITANVSWPQAILGAYLADYIPEEETEEEFPE